MTALSAKAWLPQDLLTDPYAPMRIQSVTQLGAASSIATDVML